MPTHQRYCCAWERKKLGKNRSSIWGKRRINVDVKTPAGQRYDLTCRPQGGWRTHQALVDEVLGEVDQAKREDKFQQALLTD